MIVALGEILLRLSPPGRERLFQSPRLETTFGGAEINVLVSLSLLHQKTRLLSAVPDNPIGKAALRSISSWGVGVTNVIKKQGRLGTYYYETGANQRPSVVTYDREGSVFSKCIQEDFKWNHIFKGVTWFHVTGITPALSAESADLTIKTVETVKTMKIPISIDLNFRKKLWNYGKSAKEVMPQIVELADVLIANEEDIQLSLGIDITNLNSSTTFNYFSALCEKTNQKFKNLKNIAITLRESISADVNKWSAILWNGCEAISSKKYTITHIVDRVGVGDSFAAGLIYGLLNLENDKDIIEFATAASCLKHSIKGDLNICSLQEIRMLLQGSNSGRIQR